MSTKSRSFLNKFKDFFKIDKFFFFRIKLTNLIKNNKNTDLYDYGEGYFYQSLNRINLSGLRDTRYRVDILNLKEITKNKIILDIGCNSGFVLHEMQNNFNKAVGIDYNKQLIDVADAVKEYFKIDNMEFICDDFLKCENLNNKKFDIIFSLANHSTYDNGINDTKSYFLKVFDLLEKNGILIFESHHPQYENDEKFNEIKKNLLTMYTLVKEGTYLNKNFYDKNRRFLLLKKN
jgi:SAM-dependent methyltransferase